MLRFQRLALRTVDVDAARAFYAAVLGPVALDVEVLPAAVRARGAVPHWLGHLGADDVERTAAAFVARGATRLGPPGAVGGRVVLRDAGGAVVAIEPRDDARVGGVAWCHLNARDAAATADAYRAVCGWRFFPAETLADGLTMRPFAWDDDGGPVGAVSGTEGRPGVHAHWLFHFAVPSLPDALAAARAGGASVTALFDAPDGGRVAILDDPQGAAFGVIQRAG